MRRVNAREVPQAELFVLHRVGEFVRPEILALHAYAAGVDDRVLECDRPALGLVPSDESAEVEIAVWKSPAHLVEQVLGEIAFQPFADWRRNRLGSGSARACPRVADRPFERPRRRPPSAPARAVEGAVPQLLGAR